MQKVCFFLLSCLMPFASLKAQPTGVIRGVVTDAASGQPLPSVSVVALHTSPPVGTITDLEGNFTLNALPVGRYNIQTSFIGFQSAVFREILVLRKVRGIGNIGQRGVFGNCNAGKCSRIGGTDNPSES